MSTEPFSLRPAKPRRRWLRRLLLLIPVVGVILAGLVLVRHYTHPERIRATAEDYLQRFAHGRVSVGSARFSLFGGIRLFDVTVSEVPHEATFSLDGRPSRRPITPVVSCREVKLTCDLTSIFVDRPRVRSVVAFAPTFSIVRDLTARRTNVDGLLRAPDRSEEDKRLALPAIELRDAGVKVMSRDRGRDRLVGDLRLTVRALPLRRNPDVFDVVWQGGEDRASSGHLQIDLRARRLRNVRGGLPWMPIEAGTLALDTKWDGMAARCESLGIRGSVWVRDYDLPWGSDTHQARSATIELADASISIPVDEGESAGPPEERYLRFEQINGQMELAAKEITAELTGVLHGSECGASATVRGILGHGGTLGDIDFDAQLTATDLTLPRADSGSPPAEIRFVNWARVAEHYDKYDPRGPVDLEVEVAKRAGSDKPEIRRVRLEAKGGDASYGFLSYRLKNVAGAVEYTPAGVFIRSLRGERDDAVITIEGFLEEPRRRAAKKLTIKGTGIPIDDALSDSLPVRFRKIRERFNPKGKLDIELVLTQPTGPDREPPKWRSQATIMLDDVSASFTGFPYQVDHLRGVLEVAMDELQVIDVTGQAGEARVHIGGSATFGPGRLETLDLSIQGQGVVFDDNFLSALPAEARETVDAFHPSGQFNVDTLLTLDPDTDAVRHSSRVALKDVAVRHEKIPVEVLGIRGELEVTDDEIALRDLTGRYNEATVSARGSMRRAGEQYSLELSVRTEDLQLDERLCAALPPGIRDLLSDWQIDGPIATETVIRSDPKSAGSPTTFPTVARLSGAAVRHPRFLIPFRDVQAEITIDPDGARATGIEARYGEARLRVGFDVRRQEEGSEGSITLSATGVRLDDSLRDLLPDQMAAAWDRLQPDGSIDLRLDPLRSYRSEPEGRREWSVVGYVELNDVALPGVAELEGISGTLVGSGLIADRLGGISLSGRLSLAEPSLFGRRLTQAESDWYFARAANGEGLLVFDDIRAHVYDGTATGNVKVSFGTDQTNYSLVTTVQGMQIEPVLNARRGTRLADGKPVNARGLAGAHVYLSGVVGDSSSKQGGGRFEILNGHIYRLPIIFAILKVLDLSIPERDAFDEARGEFFLVGNRMQLENVRLRSSVLALDGAGTLSLPDQGVDLKLHYVSPRRWLQVPVLTGLVEGASRELVELHVTGPLSSPRVQPRPLRAISEEFDRLFEKRKPRKIQPATP